VLGSTLTAYYDSTYCPATGCWAVAPNAGETATLTLPLAAGQYTLILGGYDSAGGPNVKYTATITAVPVPAAAWLLGGALAWLGTWRRRFALGAGSG
ncbi:MAG: hypothetical protein N3A55_10675, partial [Methylohalobius sp.]|nr:hypothetical protein [Methylohalobius sp.]